MLKIKINRDDSIQGWWWEVHFISQCVPGFDMIANSKEQYSDVYIDITTADHYTLEKYEQWKIIQTPLLGIVKDFFYFFNVMLFRIWRMKVHLYYQEK